MNTLRRQADPTPSGDIHDAGRWVAVLVALLGAIAAHAHQDTAPATAAGRSLVDGTRKELAAPAAAERTCLLRVELTDAGTHQPLGGLVRLTPLNGGGGPVPLAGLFERPAGWFAMGPAAEVRVAPGRYCLEATHGTDRTIATAVVECTAAAPASARLELQRFYDPAGRQLYNGNTHLHLLLHSGAKVGVDLADRQAADDYLRTVGGSDGLDLVYVSYVGAPGAQIISNDYTDDDLGRLSVGPTRFVNGVEHRHGGVRVKVAPVAPAVERNKIYPLDSSIVSMSYGHVLLLDLAQRSMAASVGPGLSDNSRVTDGVPLREGIADARRQGAGVIWCHGLQGLEDIPDWFAGLIHAQNIYDGGNEGTFDTVYYPYLNAGLKVPFSTGTDWGITDFSRVYVTSPSTYSSKVFLRELIAGRSYITNEPFLEFKAGGAEAGGTVTLARPGVVKVTGRAVGRSDFIRLQLVQDGRVVHEAASVPVAGHYEAQLDFEVNAGNSGWVALRIPPVQPYEYRSKYSGPGTNIFGKAIFAHTSPVYLSVAGRPVFDQAAVELLAARVQEALKAIDEMGTFANDAEREGIKRIYTEAAASLEKLLAAKGQP